MPTYKEKLNMYWPLFIEYNNNKLRNCPFCGAAVEEGCIEIHKEYHHKMMERLERIEWGLK